MTNMHGVLKSHNSCMVYWSHMTIMHGVLESHNLCMVYWSHMTIMHGVLESHDHHAHNLVPWLLSDLSQLSSSYS